jgi:hypothetical protein
VRRCEGGRKRLRARVAAGGARTTTPRGRRRRGSEPRSLSLAFTKEARAGGWQRVRISTRPSGAPLVPRPFWRRTAGGRSNQLFCSPSSPPPLAPAPSNNKRKNLLGMGARRWMRSDSPSSHHGGAPVSCDIAPRRAERGRGRRVWIWRGGKRERETPLRVFFVGACGLMCVRACVCVRRIEGQGECRAMCRNLRAALECGELSIGSAPPLLALWRRRPRRRVVRARSRSAIRGERDKEFPVASRGAASRSFLYGVSMRVAIHNVNDERVYVCI